MPTVHLIVGVLLLVLNLAAGIVGGWAWLRVQPSLVFWRLLRAAQVSIVVQVLLGALLLVLGHSPDGDLHILYGVLPLAISFIAEQLRIGSAETILEARGFGSSQEVGELPREEQRVVVLSIVRREIGVMTISCFVIVLLALRAASEAGAL
ncbi:hypothetical protein Q5424_14555 [Conexibacter sp. JD483]|uniref:hypothetical protein n=1 Tax=unclassified Conexibacter TaxID=2627773 RepID=UPI00271D73AE|nr:MULTISPECIES: hypothetical protein [unclassified Conexibacter]MDO8187405.1 hypothetical protein [Conexibacter sp. CPCC 205706]MDO8201000.1 hypothetical protein [Conexibacter sp. CPCC 205762]MDR9370321.1 hypothetical protein [Conexibacter sp. JD483]